MDDTDFNITIVGLGLIGGSLAIALRDQIKGKIWAVDRDEDTIKKAMSMGIIDEGFTEGKKPLRESDVVFVSIYPEHILSFIEENNKYFKSGAIVTDTAGVKKNIMDRINSVIRSDVDFIGGHPMAGRESRGIQYADGKIFNGANYLITPTKYNSEKNLVILEDIIRKTGCSNVIRISPEEHDEMIAYTSHLPHILAAMLMNTASEGRSIAGFVAGGYRDMTRIADINPDLWTELFLSNTDNVVKSLEEIEKNIKGFRLAIGRNDRKAIAKELERAAVRRREL